MTILARVRRLTCARRLAARLALALTLWPSLGRAADDKPAPGTKEIKAGDLTLSVPASWKQKPDVRDPRVAEFQTSAAEGDSEGAEVVVFYFGPQGAGGVRENVARWVGQFDAQGRQSQTRTGESAQGKYTLVDLTGTYKKPIGPPIQGKTAAMPGWRVINVVVETKTAPYYLKIAGPEKTVAAAEPAFRAAFGAKKDAEKEVRGE